MLDRLLLGIESGRKVSFPVYMLFYVLVVGFGDIAYLHDVQPCYYGFEMVLATLRRLY
jgi:hypothetical protein